MRHIKNFITNTLYGNSITAMLRIFLGLLFIYSGFFKALDPGNFARIILQYDVFPEILAPYGAIVMPFLEMVIGILLLSGFRIKSTSLLSSFLLTFFIIIISINVYRGNTFNCGCFELNRFEISEEIGIPLIIRDIVFLLMQLLVLCAKRQPFSIDKIIEEKNLSSL
ncbi:MAG: DoxX family membrane protein [Spirochaetes bacterium]|nr:DoxX family membrane protein [Spirochaetota bacterium]